METMTVRREGGREGERERLYFAQLKFLLYDLVPQLVDEPIVQSSSNGQEYGFRIRSFTLRFVVVLEYALVLIVLVVHQSGPISVLNGCWDEHRDPLCDCNVTWFTGTYPVPRYWLFPPNDDRVLISSIHSFRHFSNAEIVRHSCCIFFLHCVLKQNIFF